MKGEVITDYGEAEFEELPFSKSRAVLQLTGITAMTLDHICIHLLPELTVLRAIGRIAFPIFACGIAAGYQTTKNKYHYFCRLLIVGLIAQLPYSYTIANDLNIMFTLAFGLLCVWAYDSKSKPLGVFLAYTPVLFNFNWIFNYGSYGLLFILLAHIFRRDLLKLLASVALISVMFYWQNPLQLFCFAGILLVYCGWKLPCIFNKIKLPRYFFYFYYPVHLIIIFYLF